MRLFVAIDIPDAVKEHLAFLQRSLEQPGLRLVHPKNIHLTLNFLGDRDDPESIKESLGTIAFAQFTLRLDDIGFFPHEDDPSVIWVGLQDDEGLFSLQRQIDLRFKPERSFKAHLTIGRMRKASSQEKGAIVKDAHKLLVKPLSFKVDSFKLYKSTLTKFGPVYEVLHSFKAVEKN